MFKDMILRLPEAGINRFYDWKNNSFKLIKNCVKKTPPSLKIQVGGAALIHRETNLAHYHSLIEPSNQISLFASN